MGLSWRGFRNWVTENLPWRRGRTAGVVGIEIDDRAVQEMLNRLARRATHLQPALQGIGEVLQRSTKQRFADQAGPDGKAWAPNTAVTLERYLGRTGGNRTKRGKLSAKGRARLGSKKILTQDGVLADSIAPRINGGTTLEVGVFAEAAAKYANVQQYGSPGNRMYNRPGGAPAPIPAREFLGISADDRGKIERILADYLSR